MMNSDSEFLERQLSTVVAYGALTFIALFVLSKRYSSNLKSMQSLILFCWACFLKPFSVTQSSSKGNQQQSALESFYKTQAQVYDSTRKLLLQGRETALSLAAAHFTSSGKKNLVWVDIGGGTGWNIEQMNRIVSLRKYFKKVYLVDLSPSLCQVARHRFAKAGLSKIVEILCVDACDFEIPEGKADLITFSYSLSMIPTFHSAVDHASELLNSGGLVMSVDFGVQSEVTAIGRVNTVGGTYNRHVPWILRSFWRIWFEFDRVFLDPARRDYLEYRFGTLKSLNCYNHSLGKIPYYIWLGCDRDKTPALLHRINALATESPYLAPSEETKLIPKSKGYEAAVSNRQKHLPYPSIYYQNDIWRVYYDEMNPQYTQFKDQYIYAFTWEDPREDFNILKLSSKDTVLAITSAGDNILSYACLDDPPKRIHGVDLNPCQGHLMELKLAALKVLKREEVWKMFGLGKIENFTELLVTKLSPHISSNAFQYWYSKGYKSFDINGTGLYDTGSTRWALRLARWVFKIAQVQDQVYELCNCTDMDQQKEVWDDKIKPAIFNPIVSKILIGNPLFLWKALGVPVNQAKMMGSSVMKYFADTLDPIVTRSLLSMDNYFYYLTLMGHYSESNCPNYLTKDGYNKLHSPSSPLDSIRLHTDTLNDVFERLTKNSLTVAVIMDHMDWFDPSGQECDLEVKALYGALAPSGRVLLRSASTEPWYIKVFERNGYKCDAAAVRFSGESIDRINMYASTWVCTKIPPKARGMSTLDI
ncbi:unnamed protein product [Kuraishia capsulata CBS 1993]|uniref:Methyltransferase domain-containing protein n=1 Tax=Kuraishia capsulata CBS 1993 TaxID=1382522 RepID=W6MHK0_9ASCO|nr:uncharacterized protein KUCA_T00001160001 [Kuraishia capsulata CBS 1993]CDK25193.1 unnamed protein product [Kuraishia capsulata CBS 1993]